MKLKTSLTLRVIRDGKVIDLREQEMRSWVRHFFDVMYIPMADLTVTINDIGGTSRVLGALSGCTPLSHLIVGSPSGGCAWWHWNRYNASVVADNCPFSGDQFGLVIGTGNTAVTPMDDKLVTKIAHGEGAGTLLHGGTELYGLTFVNPNGSFKIRRLFTNIAGGDIAVQEVGLYCPALLSTSGNIYLFCIARDVIAAGGVTVHNGEILEVTYTPSITV